VPIDKNPEHDAGGLNADWPEGRVVFIHDKKQLVVSHEEWFEDHLEIVILPEVLTTTPHRQV